MARRVKITPRNAPGAKLIPGNADARSRPPRAASSALPQKFCEVRIQVNSFRIIHLSVIGIGNYSSFDLVYGLLSGIRELWLFDFGDLL